MPIEQRAFTSKTDGLLREIRTPVGVIPIDLGESFTQEDIDNSFQAIWDTGANNTAIASSVVKKLNLSQISVAQVSTGGGIVYANVYLLNIVLPSRVIIENVRVTELAALNNCDILIGMDVICQGDFAITHHLGKACFSFRIPSARHIDFVPESNHNNMFLVSKVNKSKKNLSKKKRKKRRK